MKESIVDRLACPRSGSSLRLTVWVRDEAEVLEGTLTSAEGSLYPIIKGVPRLLPPELLVHLPADYPEFFSRNAARLLNHGFSHPDDASIRRRTQEAFGHEWTWANDYNAINFADWLPAGYDAQTLFSGRTGLEVGCGAGRHAAATAALASEHFAVDLSIAVDSAFERTRHLDNCHVIQACAFALPFQADSFDYVYCLGVLQHMHNPVEGFLKLAQQPKKGGALIVNVYQAGRPLTVGTLAMLRKLSTRLSNRSLQTLSEVAGRIEYWGFTYPWKVLRETSVGKIIKPLVPTRIDEYARHDLRTAVVDWFDRLSCPVKIHYRKEDLEAWYRRTGYQGVVITPHWKAFWNGYGVRT